MDAKQIRSIAPVAAAGWDPAALRREQIQEPFWRKQRLDSAQNGKTSPTAAHVQNGNPSL
jgi:hypothetical protein